MVGHHCHFRGLALLLVVAPSMALSSPFGEDEVEHISQLAFDLMLVDHGKDELSIVSDSPKLGKLVGKLAEKGTH